MILDRTIVLERKNGDTPTETWEPVGQNETHRANLQPASAEATLFAGGVFGKTFVAFVSATLDVRDGDRIRTGAYSYTVRGIEDFTYGPIPHKRLTLLKE